MTAINKNQVESREMGGITARRRIAAISEGKDMRTTTVQTLERERFRVLGDYQALPCLGGGTELGFFPDFLQLDNAGKSASFSLSRAGRGDTVKTIEYHAACYEGVLPLDGDIYLPAGPSSWSIDYGTVNVYRVPKGTFVKLRPGVLHSGFFAADRDEVNVLVVLPERTYANDCVFTELAEKDWIRFAE